MHGINVILVLMGQVALILTLSRAVGLLFARLHQPQVMGEMIAGIMLGPSLFGWLMPATASAVFPAESLPALNVLSQLGVIFFLFLIGLELDPKLIQNRGHAAVVISHVSIVAPFLLGAGIALYLFPRVFSNTPQMRFTSVALFMGAAMSITAFPVLARILTERNLHKTKVGAVTITCAAVDDVTAWCMLAFVVAIARATGLRPGLTTAVLAIAYVLAMIFLVRPLLTRLQVYYERTNRLSQNIVALIFLLILGSAATTEAIGIHALFGAFCMGAIMPKGSRFVRDLSGKLEDYTVVLLLPIFFAYTGLKTRIGLLNNASLWMDTVLIIAVACAGKFGGSALAARVCGLDWRESAAIGILMNTRGLMELVILNIGRELGVISDAVFAMMVLMALVTTALTTPILNWVYPERLFGAKAPRPGRRGVFSVLIPVSYPKSAGPLVLLADMMTSPAPAAAGPLKPEEEPARQIFALHLRRPVEHEAYRSGMDETESPAAPLEAMIVAAQARNIEVEPISFVSREIAADIARTARAWSINLILMGFHKPVIGQAILGGTVHRVLTTAPCDVAIFVDRGFKQAKRLLVPFLGSKHDRLAMDLAGRIARGTGGSLTVLHLVPPGASHTTEPAGARESISRVFTEPSQPAPVEFKVIQAASPVAAVLEEAQNYDLMVIGVAEEWGLESHLFGWRSERIARECPTSLLVVRKHGEASAPVFGSQGGV